MSELARKAGQKLVAERGSDYMAKIGRAGAAKAAATRPPGFYEAIGKKGSAEMRRRRLEREEQRARELGVK